MNAIENTEQGKSLVEVSVGLKADDLDPAEITRALGIQPTRAFKKGEKPPNRRVAYPWGIWAYAVTAEDVNDAAVDILNTIEPVVAIMHSEAARRGAEINVAIFWQPEGGQGGYSLPADIMRRLSALGTRIDFYFS